MDKQLLINRLQSLHSEFIGLVNKFPEEKREEVLFDKWSLKDVLAHLTAWNQLDASHMESLQKNEVFSWVEDWDQFNEIEVAKRKSLGWNEIYQDFIQSGGRLINAYCGLSDEVWDKRFGPSNDITAIKDIQGMIDHYEKEHIPAIKRLLK